MRRLALAVLAAALTGSPSALAKAAKVDALARLPLVFEPAPASPGSGVRFAARMPGFAAGITAQGPLLRLRNGSGQDAVVSLTFPGSPGCEALEGTDPAPGISNYFRGRDPRGWRIGVQHFSRVSCRAAYPGVDIVYYGAGKRLEYDFRVSPGANPGRILMRYRGADRIRIDEKGDLVIATPAGEIVQRRPLAWQQTADGRRQVSVRYVRSTAREIGLSLGTYAPGLPLVIDPVVEYATYLGGVGEESVAGVGFDAAGNTIVAGSTMAADFPVTAGAVSSTRSGARDVFVAKINRTGMALLYSTFIGGSSTSEYSDTATALAVDEEGTAVVVGQAYSFDFPTTQGAWQATGYTFALKLDSSGSRLIYSTFLSTPGASFLPNAVAVRRGTAYIGGSTSSVAAYGTPGAFQRDYGGGATDGMLLALDAAGSRALFITLLGGTDNDYIDQLAIDSADNIVVAGYSTSPNFPAVGGVRPPEEGTTRTFVAKFNPSASSLLLSVPLHATQWVGITGLALDPTGNVIVSGSTSDLAPFSQLKEPVWLDPIGQHPSCCGFMMKLAADGSSVQAVALSKPAFGPIASGSDGFLYGIATTTPDYVSGGRPAGNTGGFVLAKISPALDRLVFSAPVLSYGLATQLAVDSLGSVHIGTQTNYSNMTVTPGAVQPKFGDQPRWDNRYPVDAFVARVNLSEFRETNFFVPATQFTLKYRIGDPEPAPTVLPIAFSGEPLTITATTDVPGLQASIAGQPASLQVRVLPSAVTPGKFNGTVTIQAWGQPALSLPISTSLEVLDRPTFTLGANQLDVQSQEGLAETRKTVSITTDFHGQYNQFQVKSDQSWLWGYASTGELTVVANPMKAGSYTGKLTVSLNGVPNSEQVVTVNYTVLPPPTMTLSRKEVWMRAQVGQPPPPPEVVHVTSSTPDFPLEVFTGTHPSFFKITATRNKAPADIVFTADLTGLTPGIWSAVTSVNLAGQPRQEITWRFAASTSAPLDVNPAEITYSYKRGWSNPYPPTITLTGSEDLDFTFSTDQPWVSAYASSVRTPAAINLSFSAGTLPEGKYQGNLVIRVPSRNITRTVPITFKVNDIPKIVFSPAQVNFKYRIGDPAPPPQVVKVTSTTALPGGFTLAAFSFNSWLDMKPLWGVPPVDLTLSLNLDKVTAGLHSGTVSIRPDYGTTGGGDIKVTLDAAPPVAVPPVLNAIVNAASYAGGEIAPGQMVAVFGTGLGPQDLAGFSLQDGRFATSVAGTRVLFGGVASPVIYSSAGQAAVIVPYGLAGKTRTDVVAEYNGLKSQPALLSVAPAAPGLFTADASGKGQGAILNFIEPAGTVEYNSPSLPATRGSIAMFYATGEGVLRPPQADGTITGEALSSPVLPVRVRIGGMEAEVLYSGTSPSLVAGLMQINVRIPAGAPTGPAVSVELQVGDYAAQTGVTMAIK